MACVAFLRGVNLGPNTRFQPSLLARQLAAFDTVNIGAAGTFVVRKNLAASRLRAEILRRLPFKPEIMICPARDLISVVDSNPFQDHKISREMRAMVTVIARPTTAALELPLCRPGKTNWEVKIIRVSGALFLSLWRPTGGRILYPNEVVETACGVPATTRSWNTIEKAIQILQK